MRRRDKTPIELSAWVINDFYPQAIQRLAPRRLRMAVLSSPVLSETYRSDPAQKKYVDYVLESGRSYDIGLFDDEGKVMHWLTPL